MNESNSALLRMGLLRRRRVWGVRAPGVFGANGERLLPIVISLYTLACLIIILVCISLMHLIDDIEVLNKEMRNIGMVIVALGMLQVIGRIHPVRSVNVYSGFDIDLLVRQQIKSKDLIFARLWLPDQVLSLSVLISVLLAVLVCDLTVAPAGVSWGPLINAILLVYIFNTVGLLVSILIFFIILKLPGQWCGIAIFATGLSLNLFRALLVLLLLLLLTMEDAGQISIDSASDIGAIVENLSRSSLMTTIMDSPSVSLMLAAVFVCLVSFNTAKLISPRSIPLVVRKINGGHRWRTLAPFSRGVSKAILDKDLRLVVRRGIPAWNVIEEIFEIFPLAIGAAAIGQILGKSTDSMFLSYITITSFLCIVVAAMALGSESLLPIISTDADGSTLGLYRRNESNFTKYLAAKSGVATAIFTCVGAMTAVIIHIVSPWGINSLLPLALAIMLAAVCEGICVVVGSAVKPALSRPALGVAELEPAVKFASAILSALSLGVAAPFVFVFIKIDASTVPTIIIASVILLAGPALSRVLAPKIYRNITKTDCEVDVVNRLARGNA